MEYRNIKNKRYRIREANKNDAYEIAELIYCTEDYPNEEWGNGSKDEHMKRLIYTINMKDNRFSYENIKVLELEEKFAGILLTLDGKRFKLDTYKADKTLYKMQKGLRNKMKFIRLALGYLFYKECEKDEFYISNIAIKTEYRGIGLSNLLLESSYEEAAKRGYEKISLRANNNELVRFYEKFGFKLVERSSDRMVKSIN